MALGFKIVALELRANSVRQRGRVDPRVCVNTAILVNKEIYTEIPVDICRFRHRLQEMKDRVRVRPVHIDFFENRKVGIVSRFGEFGHLSARVRLLITELIAGESQNFELPTVGHRLVHMNECPIVGICIASERCYLPDADHNLFVKGRMSHICNEYNLVAVYTKVNAHSVRCLSRQVVK